MSSSSSSNNNNWKALRECKPSPNRHLEFCLKSLFVPMLLLVARDCNPGLPNPGIRPIFSVPNPGICDALIPGFRDYEKCKKCPNFTVYLTEKNTFSPIFFWGGGAVPGSKAERADSNQHQSLRQALRDHGGHRSSCAFVLNKLFMRHLMLLYSISLDAQGCDAVTKKTQIQQYRPRIPPGSHGIIRPGSRDQKSSNPESRD